MRAELGLPSVKGDDEHGGGMTGGFGGSMGGAGHIGKDKRPINVKFEIPYFTTSGIQVRYLKITEPKVSPPRKSRSITSRIVSLTPTNSSNTPPSPGSATSHNPATLPCVCRTCNKAYKNKKPLWSLRYPHCFCMIVQPFVLDLHPFPSPTPFCLGLLR